MLFYRDAQRLGNPGSPGSLWPREAGEALRSSWMIKCFLMGVTLMGISYCVVQISGIYERSSTLTIFTLLAFLLIYILWCNNQKHRHPHQNVSTRNRTEPVVMTISQLVSPIPPPPFNLVYKYNTEVPPRDCTPPPSYQEAVMAMMVVTTQPYSTHAPPPLPRAQPSPPPPPILPLYVDMGTV